MSVEREGIVRPGESNGDRLPNDHYPLDLGPYPNRELRCLECGKAEGETHQDYLTPASCATGTPVVYFARLAYEAGWRLGRKRSQAFWDEILGRAADA